MSEPILSKILVYKNRKAPHRGAAHLCGTLCWGVTPLWVSTWHNPGDGQGLRPSEASRSSRGKASAALDRWNA